MHMQNHSEKNILRTNTVQDTTKIGHICAGNVKALFRRGQAKYQLAFHKEAEENFRKCLEHDKARRACRAVTLLRTKNLKGF
eukprot:4966135-Amphidinium_carterae.1